MELKQQYTAIEENDTSNFNETEVVKLNSNMLDNKKLKSHKSGSNRLGSKGLTLAEKRRIQKSMENSWKAVRPYRSGKNSFQLRKELPRADIAARNNDKAFNDC